MKWSVRLSFVFIFFAAYLYTGCADRVSSSPCAPNPCHESHKSVCVEHDGDARCVCNTGYLENRNGKCVPLDGWTDYYDEDSQQASCSDGIDNDQDGWADSQDPDCAMKGEEKGFTDYGCNDGQDNDQDGLVDAEDPDCVSAVSDESHIFRDLCNDGEDNDQDGWIDGDDPDCQTGREETGLGNTECNDGSDNDGDGYIDGDDSDCTSARYNSEADNVVIVDCQDSVDNDGDGWVDMEDPECAPAIPGNVKANYNLPEYPSENGVTFYSENLSKYRGKNRTALDCNDGADSVSDSDNNVDSQDAQCYTAWFYEDYASVSYIMNSCSDGVDNDWDGWIDSDDPDCDSNSASVRINGSDIQVEMGTIHYSTTSVPECNDGVDNDSDGSVDASDVGCSSGMDNDESQ